MSVSHQLSHQEKKMCTREDVVKGHRFPSLAFCSYESEKVIVEVRKWEIQLRTVHLVFTLQSAARMQVERRRRRRRSWTSQKCISHLILLKIAPGCVKVLILTRLHKLVTSLLAGNIWTIRCQLTSTHQRRKWISQRRISDLRWPLGDASQTWGGIGQEFSWTTNNEARSNWNLEREKALNWLCLITCTAGHRWQLGRQLILVSSSKCTQSSILRF